MFKKDEYIVTLIVDIGSHCAKNNYCFKQKRNSDYISPCLDLKGSKTNDNLSLTFDKSQHLKDWRYATEEEAEHYELIGKPYDVTTLTEFILPDNWHILVTEENAKDVLKWRFEDNYNRRDNTRFLDYIVGMDGTGFKGHNPKDQIKSEDSYDFGNEITYAQFKKYVLKFDDKPKQKEDLSYLIPFLHNLNIT